MEFTTTDKKIKRLIYECIEELGGMSDILGTIGSWKETISNEDVLGALQSWLNATRQERIVDAEIAQDGGNENEGKIPILQISISNTKSGGVRTYFMVDNNKNGKPQLITDKQGNPISKLEENPFWVQFSEEQSTLKAEIGKLITDFKNRYGFINFIMIDGVDGEIKTTCVLEEDKMKELLNQKQ